MNRIILLLTLQISFLFCSMNMEGFYEGQFGKTYESDYFEWNMWDPNFYLETRLYASPIQNSNFYIKISLVRLTNKTYITCSLFC